MTLFALNYSSSNKPSFAAARNSCHSSRLMWKVESGSAELRTMTTSPCAATSTHAPPSHLPFRHAGPLAGSPVIAPPGVTINVNLSALSETRRFCFCQPQTRPVRRVRNMRLMSPNVVTVRMPIRQYLRAAYDFSQRRIEASGLTRPLLPDPRLGAVSRVSPRIYPGFIFRCLPVS
jgi:hypothetical protein